MQSVCEIIAAFVTALGAAAFSHFGVTLEPQVRPERPEVRKTAAVAPPVKTPVVYVRANAIDCPEHRVKAA
jgi:hypothetical protein